MRAGLGVGLPADYLARGDAELASVLQVLQVLLIPSLPLWPAVHRGIRGDVRIRAVYDFLARAVPGAL